MREIFMNIIKTRIIFLKQRARKVAKIDNSGRIMSRKEIASLVWEKPVSLRTVDAVVSRLRKKLGDNHITTRFGFGYGVN